MILATIYLGFDCFIPLSSPERWLGRDSGFEPPMEGNICAQQHLHHVHQFLPRIRRIRGSSRKKNNFSQRTFKKKSENKWDISGVYHSINNSEWRHFDYPFLRLAFLWFGFLNWNIQQVYWIWLDLIFLD